MKRFSQTRIYFAHKKSFHHRTSPATHWKRREGQPKPPTFVYEIAAFHNAPSRTRNSIPNEHKPARRNLQVFLQVCKSTTRGWRRQQFSWRQQFKRTPQFSFFCSKKCESEVLEKIKRRSKVTAKSAVSHCGRCLLAARNPTISSALFGLVKLLRRNNKHGVAAHSRKATTLLCVFR